MLMIVEEASFKYQYHLSTIEQQKYAKVIEQQKVQWSEWKKSGMDNKEAYTRIMTTF